MAQQQRGALGPRAPAGMSAGTRCGALSRVRVAASAAPMRSSAPWSAGVLAWSSAAAHVPARAAPRRQQRPSRAVAAGAAAERLNADAEPVASSAGPKLSDLPIQAIVNQQGYVAPALAPGGQAWVFAVYDEAQKLQFIGFSKDLTTSLRTVLGRRPDKAWFYKAAQLDSVDQEAMLALRQAWFDECGAPPPGNKLALERKAWQSAVDAGAISARAKPAAGAEKARELQAALRARGCVEEFVPNPELLADGQVDFLPPTGGGEAAAAAGAAAAAAAAESGAARPVRSASAVVDGQAKTFDVEYCTKFQTKGGYLFDVKLSFDHMDTKHRVIVGRQYYEPYGLPPEAPVEAALSLLLGLKLPRHSEGMLGSAEFPVNYFTISEAEQWFEDDFAAAFLHVTGATLVDGTGELWRMNKVNVYGGRLEFEAAASMEDPAALGAALVGRGLGAIGG
ncbi:hypothetical protein HT031_003178 [Scenedesmus sp. PABB004]|nr:hypothetical protein HT031_003178 [Scenedesmus sp. PABB004]